MPDLAHQGTHAGRYLPDEELRACKLGIARLCRDIAYTSAPRQNVWLHHSWHTVPVSPSYPWRILCSIHPPQHYHQDSCKCLNSFPISCWSKAFCPDSVGVVPGSREKAGSTFHKRCGTADVAGRT